MDSAPGSGGVAERKTPAAARVGGSAALLGHGCGICRSSKIMLVKTYVVDLAKRSSNRF